MNRRAYLTGTAVALASVAGCSGDGGGIDAEPAVDRFGLMRERGAYGDLSDDLDEIELGTDVVFGAEYAVPVDSDEVDYEAEVRVLTNGQVVDREATAATEEVETDQDSIERQGWFEFSGVRWAEGPHRAEFEVHDRHTETDAGPATAAFDVVLPTVAVTDVSPVEPSREQGAPLEVDVTVENDGEVDASGEVELSLGGDSVGSESVTVGPGGQQDVTFELDTADLALGDHEFEVVAQESGRSGTLTVTEPLPDPAVVEELIPVPTEGDTSQDGRDFSIVVRNEGDPGEVRVALTFSDSLVYDPWSEPSEGSASAELGADEETELTVHYDGSAADAGDYYQFRLWPVDVAAEVANEGYGDGVVDVSLEAIARTLATKSVTIAAGDTETVDFRIEDPDEEPLDLSIDASAQ